MKFGIMDHVLGTKTDAESFDRCRRLGADGIELNLKIAELKDPASPRAETVRQLVRQHGLPVSSCVLGEHNSGGLATWWRGADADREIRLALEFCQAIAAPTLLVPFFFFNEPKGASHRRATAERIRPLAQYAQSLGVTFAFEGVTPAKYLVEMAEVIASPSFGVYFDMANLTWCDLSAPEEIRTLGSLLRQTHSKEAATYTGDAHLGKGRVDHAACAAALKSIRYDGWVVLETPGGTDEAIAADLAFARHTYGTP